MRIRKDPWISRVDSILAPPACLGWDPHNAIVNLLMDQPSIRWNIHSIKSLFDPLVATSILKISLSLEPHVDKWIWKEEKSGKFSVKSAYFLIHSTMVLPLGETSSSHTLLSVWKAIWSMKIPHKIWIFAWRAYKNDLPCLYNLLKKKILVNSSCNFCQAPIEDLSHALFYCLKIKEWWSYYLTFMIEVSPNLGLLGLMGRLNKEL